MNLSQPVRSSARLYVLAVPLLYAAVNLIAIQLAAHPTGLHPGYEVPWNPTLLGMLGDEIDWVRNVTFGITVILAAEACCLAVFDRRRRRSGALTIFMGEIYVLTLALVALVNPTSGFWDLNEDSGLAGSLPGWHGPALVAIAVVTVPGLVMWLSEKGGQASLSGRKMV
ncbi:hypothetical protein ABZ897_12970 [Nonomuraea sp. NPDC046802]|uniref:hypothetical protein n=1 Tax=Nonomuraea sp. NPDC046802 TaxID=3154919 RepID=UPI0033E64B36